MGQLYLFANECPAYANEENWKTCLGRVCNRYNTLKSRAFELNVNAMKPLYSMLHTGNFVFDNEIKSALIPFGRENKEAYSLVYYDNTCDAYGVSAAEEVAEQDSSYM